MLELNQLNTRREYYLMNAISTEGGINGHSQFPCARCRSRNRCLNSMPVLPRARLFLLPGRLRRLERYLTTHCPQRRPQTLLPRQQKPPTHRLLRPGLTLMMSARSRVFCKQRKRGKRTQIRWTWISMDVRLSISLEIDRRFSRLPPVSYTIYSIRAYAATYVQGVHVADVRKGIVQI